MKNILLIATTLFSIFTFAQVDPIISIPDANFKAKLLAASPSNGIASTETPVYNSSTQQTSVSSYHKIDTNNDGEIQASEALVIKFLNVSCANCTNNLKISTLDGILNFTNLQYLYCQENQLTSLNLQGLSNLLNLRCSHNQLTSLNVQGLINLQHLISIFNNLTTLDLQGLDNLYELDVSVNQLTTLNIQGLNNLQILRCPSNQLTSLNYQGLINLKLLQCGYNQLSNLNLQDLTNLLIFQCNNNQLTSLITKNGANIDSYSNFSNNPNLQYICCSDNQLTQVQQKVTQYGYTNCHVNTYCSFTPGGNYNTISGQIKYDFNQNGCDTNDEPFSYKLLQFSDGTNTGYVATDNLGNYNAYANTGTFTLTPQIENPSFFVFTPPSAQVTFSNNNYNTQTQNFCITPNGIHHDVEVTLIPITPARPGFDATYKIIYKNKGNQVENGTVTLTYLNQDALDIVSCNPAFNSENSDGFEKTLTWNYVNLQPFQTREITVILNLNGPMETPALNIGETLSMTSIVTPEINDETPIDNHSDIRQVIVGSYDPNDKTCIEGATITPAMVGEYVHYVIRFENTGTYPAQNVVVKDMIDLAKFDIATLLPIKASHNFETRIAGNKVEFIFENINLPFDDANNDGYVAFKIKTKPTLVLGDTFSNQANIYFDYNFPIITNNYTTTVQNTLGLQDNEIANVVLVHPNPVKDILYFNSKETIFKIEIYDIAGRIISSNSVSENKLDVSNLKSGTYFVTLFSENGALSKKIIKE